MKNKVLVSLVLLAFVTVSAAFAQQATLDKLSFASSGSGYQARPANKTISGAVVIPDTYNNKYVVSVGNFTDCQGITSVTIPNSVTSITLSTFRGCVSLTSVNIPNNVTSIPNLTFSGCSRLTSITIPASVTSIGQNVFDGCTNLNSVTFQGSNTVIISNGIQNVFPGGRDLPDKYKAGGAGTYTRQQGGTVWTKTASAPAPNTSLDGNWESENGMTIRISGNTAVISYLGSLNALWSSAKDKGYLKEGSQCFRNLRSTGNLTWSGQYMGITYNSSSPNVATGTTWLDCTITMSVGGGTFNMSNGTVWERERVFNN
jgi:hypothetical protein